MEYTASSLTQGSVYRFYVVAKNSIGKSAASPVLSVVAGILPGQDSNLLSIYSLFSPVLTAIDSSAVTLSWLMTSSNSTGGTPLTGYQVYQFDGVGLNTLSSPNQVYNEVQMITTSVAAKQFAIQKVVFSSTAWTSFAISRNGVLLTTVTQATYATTGSLQALMSGTIVTIASTNTFTVNFTSTAGAVDNLVIYNLLPATVTANVTTEQIGTDVLGGSFALSYNNSMTVDLPYSASADDMKIALEDLPGVGIVIVTRALNLIGGVNRGAYAWTVSFESAAGDLPIIEAYAGRLTPLASSAALVVTEVTAGSSAVLVYDGRSIPEVRSKSIMSLSSDSTYAFKVLPYNSLGAGILSKATLTVIPRSGASAAYTTASGSSLVSGIAYGVDEQQVITATNCGYQNGNGNQTFTVGYNSVSVNSTFSTNQSTASLEAILQNLMTVGTVHVEREDSYVSPYYVTQYLVTFIGAVDVKPIRIVTSASAVTALCTVTVEEFLKGVQNSFSIQPKQVKNFFFLLQQILL
jgi:hypothetical protein